MILIIDDDEAVRRSLSFMLSRAGYESKAVSSPEETLELVRRQTPQLVLMDLNYGLGTSGEAGLTLMRQVKIFHPDVPIILITAWGSIALAVEGMRAGAFDFVTKPWDNTKLLATIETALALNEWRMESGKLRVVSPQVVSATLNPQFLTLHSLNEVLCTVSRIAPTHAPVLITGESGTGKELIAEAIHAHSRRSEGPFVKVNLGGLSQSLFESEMFGHCKGSFTGATTDRMGRFAMADKGTIFLDEIGDLDFGSQVKLLRVLQDQTYEALGDSRPRRTDVRVISATNADLPRMVAEKSFREDLFYRINLITIHLPPLRERVEDIPLLAAHFARKQSEATGLPPAEFTPEAFDYLKRLPFAGNIRELNNLVERTILLSGKDLIGADDLFCQNESRAQPAGASFGESLTLDEIERQSIVKAFEKHGGNISQIARSLGISRAALYRRMEKYGIEGK